MCRRCFKQVVALGGGLLLGASSLAWAETAPDGVQDELSALKARIAELEGKKDQTWLNQRQAEQVKALIHDVLADADTRASLLEGGMSAGHNGENFFLSNEDGTFLLNLNGMIQVRHIANFRDEDGTPGLDEVDEAGARGFAIARAKLHFHGHIADPAWHYSIRLAVDEENSVEAEEILIKHQMMDNLWVWVGETKAPFLREELVAPSHQLAVERLVVNELFTTGYAQGIGAQWDPNDTVRVGVAFTDGTRSAQHGSGFITHFEDDGLGGRSSLDIDKQFDADRSDFAVTARIDVRLAGEWDQWNDFTAWQGQEMGAFVGAAFHYELGETGDSAFNNNFVSWTIDGSIHSEGLSAFAAVVGLHEDLDGSATDAGFSELEMYGFVAQAGYMVTEKLQPFIRYEYIDLDDLSDDLSLITVGANYYFNKHAAKASLDLVWALDPLPTTFTSIADPENRTGILSDNGDEDNQVAIRAQLQLLF